MLYCDDSSHDGVKKMTVCDSPILDDVPRAVDGGLAGDETGEDDAVT